MIIYNKNKQIRIGQRRQTRKSAKEKVQQAHIDTELYIFAHTGFP